MSYEHLSGGNWKPCKNPKTCKFPTRRKATRGNKTRIDQGNLTSIRKTRTSLPSPNRITRPTTANRMSQDFENFKKSDRSKQAFNRDKAEEDRLAAKFGENRKMKDGLSKRDRAIVEENEKYLKLQSRRTREIKEAQARKENSLSSRTKRLWSRIKNSFS